MKKLVVNNCSFAPSL